MSGTYRIRKGEAYSIGSTTSFRQTRRELKRDPDICDMELTPLDFIHREDGESDDSFVSRIRFAEQRLIDTHWGRPGFCNDSRVAMGPTNGLDPIHYATGERNGRSRAVIVTCPDSKTIRFETVSLAAGFLKVSQQLASLWLSGSVPWPSPYSRCRKSNEWLFRYSARYDDPSSQEYGYSARRVD